MSLEQERAFQGLKEAFRQKYPNIKDQDIKLNFDIYKDDNGLTINARIQETDIEIVMIHIGNELDWAPSGDFISMGNIYSISKAVSYLQGLIQNEQGKRTSTTASFIEELANMYKEISADYGSHGDRDNS